MRCEREQTDGSAATGQVTEAHPAGPAPSPVGNGELGRLIQRWERTGSASQGAGPLDPDTGDAIEAARSGGSGLPGSVRSDMEGHFGVDLSAVRVHTGTRADALNQSVQARAFTVGSDIFFSGGSYDPSGTEGRELLAHELTHVVQQNAGLAADGVAVSHPADPAEEEARRVATAIATAPSGVDPAARLPLNLLPSTAGNRAVARFLAPQAVQRFAGPEHEQLGNATGATIDLGGGIVLTWGEVVAIAGDEYGSVDELRADLASPGGPARLRGRLVHDRVAGPIPAVLPAESEHSSARYVELAMHNAAHFSAGGTAIPTWRSYHENALLLATMSGMDGSDQEWQQAQLNEAFGQHFLTDSFSAGHVRTPRAEIMAWYQSDFAPRALGPFLTHARQVASKALTDDLGRQMQAPMFVVEAEFNAILAAVLALFDGMIRDRFQDLFGLGISGAISGVLHDQDNDRGLWVRSEAHPDPWMAYGDGNLGCSQISRDQAELAVITAREQLVAAQALGRIRAAERGVTPAPPGQGGPVAVPGTVHFGFDSSSIDAGTAAALDAVANYLIAHTDQSVVLVGHTCPLGDDGYNLALGMRRAEAVAAGLMARGVAPARISTTSAGETQVVSADPQAYSSDRRVELSFLCTGDEPPDLVWAQQVIAERWSPPYQAVERYVPEEAPDLNDPQEDWHWGTLTSTMAGEVDTWVAHYVTEFKPSVLANPALDDRTIPVPDFGILDGVTVSVVRLHPRPIVEQILDEVIKAPTAVIGALVGVPAANRSTKPPPPLVPCRP
jgi:outer membrane protein OmpA-like peptidoglycan-associated protein